MINIHNYFEVNWEATSDNIKSLIRNHVSYKVFAEAMCVSKRTVQNWCNNKAKPSIDNLILMSKLFNLDLLDILITNGQLTETITEQDYEKAHEIVENCYAKEKFDDTNYEIKFKEEVQEYVIFNELVRTTYPVTTLNEFLLLLPLVNFSDLRDFFERIKGNIGINQDYVYSQLKYLYDNIPADSAKEYVEAYKEYYLKYPSIHSIYEDSQLPVKLLKIEKYLEISKSEDFDKVAESYDYMFEFFLDKLFKRRKFLVEDLKKQYPN